LLEYLAGSSRADLYASAIEDTDNLLVPVTSIYEVFKKVLREAGEDAALGVAAAMHAGTVVELDIPLALEAARYPLPPADSLIYATARSALLREAPILRVPHPYPIFSIPPM
jgi:PIN domain nuclease of toxin-antitoxin system